MRQLILLSAVCVAFFQGAALFAQGPGLERIERAGGMIGTEFDLICHGELLKSVNGVQFYDDGLSLVKVRSEDDSTVTLTVRAAEDLLPNEYPLRLLSPSGVSDLRTIHVSPFRQMSESEPNNTTANSQSVETGVTIHGVVDEGDVDQFRLNLVKGQRVSIEVVGIRNTMYVFDSRIAVRNANGEEIAVNDDCPLLYQDPMLSFVAPDDGEYFVHLREAAFGGDPDSVYQLHIGEHPRPVVCYPAGGESGSEQTLTLIGDARGPKVITRMIPGLQGNFEHFPVDESGIAPSPVKLRSSPFPNTMEVEPNDTVENATESLLSLPVALNGILQAPGDVDVFRFRATEGASFDVDVFGHRIGSPVDTVVTVERADGTLLVRNDDGVNHDSRFRFVASETGEYLISVTDHLGRGGDDYVYRVEFQQVEPKLELTVPIISERHQQQRQRIQLPRGGRMALIVSARRQSLLSDVEISPDFLPEGVTATASRITKNSHLGYILFEAAEDAPLDAGLFGVNGVSTGTQQSTTGRLRQKTGLSFGPPRRTVYHSIEVDQIPITVIDAGFFQLDVGQPVIPLARDGQLDLKVTARRSNYDGEIRLTLPILPPWIEVPEDGVVIPAGEESTTFTITATDNAASARWTILMMGHGDIDGHEVFASSEEFSFEVVDPYLDVSIERSIARQGERARIECKSSWRKGDQSAPAVARLRGLPKHIDAPEILIPAGAKEFAFEVAVGDETPASIHNTLYLEVEVPRDGVGIRHFLGRGGVLEVLAEGEKPRETRSRLDVLRSQAGGSTRGSSSNSFVD